MFKNVDKKLEEIGFTKTDDDDSCVRYIRVEKGFTQAVCILRKNSGRHILQSYDVDLYDTKMIGNTNVGLTYSEMKLFIKKMKQKKWCS